MSRRRVRLVTSSDEEEEEGAAEENKNQQQNRNQTQILIPPNPIPSSNFPLEISDDDLPDVPDFVCPFSSPPPVSDTSVSPSAGDSGHSDSPVEEFFRKLGLCPRREWLDSCISGLMSSVPGFSDMDVAGKAKLCFSQFLHSDMNHSGRGVLPENVHAMHGIELAGPFVLQVDEVVNISSTLREGYHDAPSGPKRCLKLSMTDGAQRVFGMEYRPIKTLEVLSPAGLKISIHNVHIRRGLLMLVPEVVDVLGGLVEDLDAAHCRLVEEVNKPPRGKRTCNGEAVPLARRARLAAWPSTTVNDSSRLQGPNFAQPSGNNNIYSPQLSGRGATVYTSGSDAGARTAEDFADHRSRSDAEGNLSSLSSAMVSDAALATSGSYGRGIVREMIALPGSGPVIIAKQSSSAFSDIATFVTSDDDIGRTREGFAVPSTKSDAEANRSSTSSTVSDVEIIHKVAEVEHPIMLSGNMEKPFTYLASVLSKCTVEKDNSSSINGKIKCLLTGVKRFQFKHRSTFELCVYVDDGSLIAEILIDHNLVQKGIGYSPEEVTAALSSSDKKIVSDMRETMKQYQLFLANFEGTILVEINKHSSLPTALEMNQGCPASVAWLLLRRLKNFTAPPTSLHQHMDPIHISL